MPRARHTAMIECLIQGEISADAESDPLEALRLMQRALPPTRALLAVSPGMARGKLRESLWADLLDIEVVSDRRKALSCLTREFYPIVLTDSLELIRALRHRRSRCSAVIIYFSVRSDSADRAAGIRAGADECLGSDASEEELHARITAARRVAELESVLRTALAENHRLSSVDDLTRIGSKQFFNRQFAREAERAARCGRALSLILCDIDHFKIINDTLGHASGDEVLRHFGTRLQRLVHGGCSWIARVGGEEFAIVLPGVALPEATEKARTLCIGIAAEPFRVAGRCLEVTASFGLCGVDRVFPEEKDFAEQAFKAADEALYRSKRSGRNRVTTTTLPTPNLLCACG
ncbi:MAG TPA: diguanylate cyclase [Steroidobacteraceae bacterium]|nr:diguanylate cyclase [Steroidobacteraceae bacterium]